MERDPEEKRRRVVDAAVQRLSSQGFDALRMLLTPSSLAEESGVGRDSAYRLFGRKQLLAKDDVVLEAARIVHSLDAVGADGGIHAAALRYAADVGLPVPQRLRATLRAILEANTSLPNTNAGWLLHAAVLPYHADAEARSGSTVDPADRALDHEPAGASRLTAASTSRDRASAERVATEIRQVRAAMYRQVDAALDPMLALALDDHERRPEPGVALSSILLAMHCLIDGAVLRYLIDPENVDLDFLADALYRLAYAYSEPGTADDPRRPVEAPSAALFDVIVSAARAQWELSQDRCVAPARLELDEVARSAGVDTATVHVLFPTLSDLADSVLRLAMLSNGGGSASPVESGLNELAGSALSSPAGRRVAVSRLAGLLRRVSDVADQFPSLMALVDDAPPHVEPSALRTVLGDLTESMRVLLPADKAAREAERLLRFAKQGAEGWPATSAILAAVVDLAGVND